MTLLDTTGATVQDTADAVRVWVRSRLESAWRGL